MILEAETCDGLASQLKLEEENPISNQVAIRKNFI
jgi:hypothetical protein